MTAKAIKVWGSVLLTLVVSLGLAFFTLKSGPPISQVNESVSRMGMSTLFLALLFVLLQNLFMMIRVWILGVSCAKGFAPQRAFKAIALGQFVNSLAPARLGDFLKIAFMTGGSERRGLPFATSTGVIVADKGVDTIAFFLLVFFTGAVFLPEFWNKIKVPEMSTTGIAIGLGVLGTLVYFLRRTSGVIKAKWVELRTGIFSAFHPKFLLPAVACGVLVWIGEALALRALGSSLGISLDFARIFFLFSLLNLAIAVPISIGNLGVFEAAIVAGLGVLAVPTSEAIAIAVMHHLIQVVAVTVWGMVALPFAAKEMMTWRSRSEKSIAG